MKKTLFTFLTLTFIGFSSASFSQKNDVKKADETIQTFKKEDPGMTQVFKVAYGYVVFPGIGKGGLGVGGAHGKGTVYEQGKAMADASMTQVTVGFQAGGQKYAEVVFFETEAAFDKFMSNDFEFSAQVSAIALKSGASADAKYRDGIMVFTMGIGGLMYEASIGGQKFKSDPFE